MTVSYAIYHAKDWAIGKTAEEIREEIKSIEKTMWRDIPAHEVGNKTMVFTRLDTLKEILRALDRI